MNFTIDIRETSPKKEPPAVVFDDKALTNRLMNNLAFTSKIISIFLNDTSKQIRKLTKTVREHNWEVAVQMAHTIKGGAASVGGNKLHAAVLEIEKACKTANWGEAEALLPELNKQFEILERAMREYLKTLSRRSPRNS